MNSSNELVEALAPVIAAFEQLQISHCIGGSIASSFHGAARATMDVDVLCDISKDLIADFLKFFGTDYYVSEPAVRDAVERRSCFNLIHIPTAFKIDVFVSEGRPFDSIRMQRATREDLGEDRVISVPMTSLEDVIISKLEWFRKGNETSERQWNDVSRLARLMGESIDLVYLRDAAESVGVADLLNRLLEQV